MKLNKLSNKITKSSRTYIPSDLLVLPTNMVGVEIEIEGVRTDNPAFRANTNLANFWEPVSDQSLRGGTELRFKGPLFGQDLIQALKYVDATLKKVDHVASIRTSTHVHFDLERFDDSADLLKLLAVSGIFEKTLFKYIGHGREDSIYCIPFLSARGDFQKLSTLGGNPMGLNKGTGRYQAINIQSMFAHGTIEFRHANALTTYNELLDWINILGSIVKYASEGDFDIDKLSTLCSEKSPIDFLCEVFPDHHDKLIYDGLDDDIIKSARMVDDMVHYSSLQSMSAYRGLENPDGGLAASIFKKGISKAGGGESLSDKSTKWQDLVRDGGVRGFGGIEAVPAPPPPVQIDDVEEDNGW